MPMSKSAVKTAKWKTENGKRKSAKKLRRMAKTPTRRQDIYGAALWVERVIDTKLTELSVLAPPRHKAERVTLVNKIVLASCFVRVKLPERPFASNHRLADELCSKMGAIAIAKVPEDEKVLAFFDNDDAAMLALLTHG